MFQLQKKPAMRFHVCGLALFLGALVYNVSCIYIPNSTNTYGGRWKYLTYINLNMQSLYFAVALVCDVLMVFPELCSRMKRDAALSRQFVRARDFFFATVVFPAGMFVPMMFWGLFAINTEFVFPELVRKYIRLHGLYNHTAHTLPLFAVLTETYLVSHRYPSRKSGQSFALGFSLAYIGFLVLVALRANIWAYGVLAGMTWPVRGVFFAGILMVGQLLYLLGEHLERRKKETQWRINNLKAKSLVQ